MSRFSQEKRVDKGKRAGNPLFMPTAPCRATLWRILTPAPPPFSLLPSEPYSEAAWHMALDESLFDSAAENLSSPILRLYRWSAPAITIGRFQNAEKTLDLHFCRRENLPIVRRMTGGRGILHGDDLTISVASSIEDLGLSDSVSILTIYDRIAGGFIQAFQALGIAACMGTCERKQRGVQGGDCFAAISRADVIDRQSGEKLLGAALYRKERSILLQSSLPLRTSEQGSIQNLLASGAFRGLETAVPGTFKSHTWDRAEPDVPRFVAQLCQNMMAALSGEAVCSDVTEQETDRALLILKNRYASSNNVY